MGCCNSDLEPKSIPKPVVKEPSPIVQLVPKLSRRPTLSTTRIDSITEKYVIIRALGSETKGTFFLAHDIQSGCSRAIFEVNKQTLIKGFEFQEYNILRQLDHPNIIKIFEAFETSKNLYMVHENISGGALIEKFQKIGYEGSLSKYIHELFSALNYLHKKKIIHCNLSPEFIVLSTEDDDAILKIIGFSQSQKLSEKREVDISQLKYEYASPEILQGTSLTEKTDIWSAGLIVYNILTARYPFPRGSMEETIRAIEKGKIDYSNSAFLSLSVNAQDLLKKILILDPELRPTCEEILAHPWFHESKQTLPITYNIAKKLSTFNIKSTIARALLTFITMKLSLSKKDYTIINYFKSLDLNNDGKVSKEEILNVFNQVGLNVINEIDFIMDNLDYDRSGFIDYTELILALTNWPQELKKKNLAKVFSVVDHSVKIDDIKEHLQEFETEEWDNFFKKVPHDKGKINLQNLKVYLKSQVS